MRHPLLFSVAAGIALLIVLAVILPQQEDHQQKKSGVTNNTHTGVFQTTCATCHGEKGEGNRELMTPSIASLPRWYMEEQIYKFRNGQRGAHPEDIYGQSMRAAITALSEQQIAEALDFIETLPALSHPSTLTGDAEIGYELYYDNCMACHRFNGHGELIFSSASLNGLQDWYLLEQLKKFENGIRGYHADDISGIKMRDAVSFISSNQDKIDILALLSSLAKKYPVEKNSKNQTPKTK